MADEIKTSFRAKAYKNRKDEARLQVSGLQADFIKLAKGDESMSDAFKQQIVTAVKESK